MFLHEVIYGNRQHSVQEPKSEISVGQSNACDWFASQWVHSNGFCLIQTQHAPTSWASEPESPQRTLMFAEFTKRVWNKRRSSQNQHTGERHNSRQSSLPPSDHKFNISGESVGQKCPKNIQKPYTWNINGKERRTSSKKVTGHNEWYSVPVSTFNPFFGGINHTNSSNKSQW